MPNYQPDKGVDSTRPDLGDSAELSQPIRDFLRVLAHLLAKRWVEQEQTTLRETKR